MLPKFPTWRNPNFVLCIAFCQGVSSTAPAAAGDMASMTSNMATLQCSINNQDDCVMCGS